MNTAVVFRKKPIVRWAGGKNHLVHQLIRFLPARWNRYIEPMVGGGALFFHLAQSQVLLADINADLICFFSVLKRSPDALISKLLSLRSSKRLYYELRELRPRSAFERAWRFAYLNRLCWNGLFRVNQAGLFNVPIGDRLPTRLWSPAILCEASAALQTADLVHGDFEATLASAARTDLVFLDPPYPRGATFGESFKRYSSMQFHAVDHVRLADLICSLHERGVYILLTLSESQLLQKIYPGWMKK